MAQFIVFYGISLVLTPFLHHTLAWLLVKLEIWLMKQNTRRRSNIGEIKSYFYLLQRFSIEIQRGNSDVLGTY